MGIETCIVRASAPASQIRGNAIFPWDGEYNWWEENAAHPIYSRGRGDVLLIGVITHVRSYTSDHEPAAASCLALGGVVR